MLTHLKDQLNKLFACLIKEYSKSKNTGVNIEKKTELQIR